MLLNRLERLLMNNPVRSAVQRGFEVRRLLSMGGAMNGGRALEIGCGRGVGTQLILDLFKAETVDALDVDPSMVELALGRVAEYGDRVRLLVADAQRIPARDDTYDAVFDFGTIHHIVDWRAAVRELHRVLKPGGRLYAEEVLDAFVTSPVWRRLLDHPQHDRFDARDFAQGLAEAGFEVVDQKDLAGRFAWFVADKRA